MKKTVEPELPTELTIDGELVDDIDDIEAYLDEVISDWLSDEYGFDLGFADIVGTDVHVTNILWDQMNIH